MPSVPDTEDPVILLTPTYQLANTWARTHDVSRRRLKIIVNLETTRALYGLEPGYTVRMFWPPGHGKGRLLDQIKDVVTATGGQLVHC